MLVLCLISSVLHQDIGWEERLRDDVFCVSWSLTSLFSTNMAISEMNVFCVEWDVKP